MFLLLFLVTSLTVCFYNFYWKRRNLPPGPTPLPFFGNTLQIQKYAPGYEAYKKWTKEYGPVHTIWLGEFPVVLVSDFDLIMETFIKDGGDYGIVSIDGDIWREQRRFTLHVIRNFGKNVLQEKILSEVTPMIEKIQKELKSGKTEFDIPHISNLLPDRSSTISCSNGVYEFYELKRLVSDFARSAGNPLVFTMQNRNFEYTKYIPYLKNFYYRLENAREKLYEFFMKQIEEHQKRVDPHSEPSDYVEAFLREKARKEEEGNIMENYSMNQLYGMLFDLWIAGQESTSNTMSLGFLALMQEPEVQARMQQEFDAMIGSDRLITMDDRSKLNYTVAVVNEVNRIANVLPLNVRHATTRDVTINGYHLPKGTCIVPQISVILSDEKIFPNPEKFDPTRFLDESGEMKKIDALIPFSIGKRQCIGESMAMMEVFLFIANCFNQFMISVIPEKPPSNMRKSGSTVAPYPFVCKIVPRH